MFADIPFLQLLPAAANACVAAYGAERSRLYSYDRTVSVGDSQLRILANKEFAIVAIAGTNSLADWVANFDVKPRNVGPFRLHSGFAKQAEVSLAALAAVDDLPRHFAEGNWMVCGHSLGGAVAAIIPALLATNPSERLELPKTSIGFGVPNYVQGPGALLWPCRIVAINSSRDIVSHLPNGLFCRPWTRAGLQVFADDSGLHSYAGHELLRIASLFWRLVRFAWLSEIKAVAEHSIELYADRVSKGVRILERKRGEFDV